MAHRIRAESGLTHVQHMDSMLMLVVHMFTISITYHVVVIQDTYNFRLLVLFIQTKVLLLLYLRFKMYVLYSY